MMSVRCKANIESFFFGGELGVSAKLTLKRKYLNIN